MSIAGPHPPTGGNYELHIKPYLCTKNSNVFNSVRIQERIGNTMNLDPHFLAMLIKACSEADFNDEEISVENSTLEFLESLLKKHPEQEVADYYLNEISRLRGEHGSNA